MTLQNCYKTIFQTLTDWSNWTKLGLSTMYFGLLDYCQNSQPYSVPIYTWNPVPSDQTYLFYGNAKNGDPSVDWASSETGTFFPTLYTPYVFNYCWQMLGNEYELNNGGLNGDIYCATGSTWTRVATPPVVYSTSTAYNRATAPSACV